MSKCGACGRFLASAGAAQCAGCPAVYHRACVALPNHIIISSVWQCPECTKNRPKGNNAATPVKGLVETSGSESEGQTTATGDEVMFDNDERPNTVCLDDTAHNDSQMIQVEFGLEVRLFRDELRGLREEIRAEFRDLRRELSDIRVGLATCNCRVDKLESRFEALEKHIQTKAPPDGNVLEQTVENLKQQLNARDQDLLQTDLDISNLPEVRGENVAHTVVTIAAKLGVPLENRDIVYAERVGARQQESGDGAAVERGRRVVVRLVRRQLRDELLRAARVRRGVTSADLGLDGPARRFYVNERLTRATRHLFYLAREAARRTHWKYAWTRNGRIYARQADGKPARQIRSENELAVVFGVDSV